MWYNKKNKKYSINKFYIDFVVKVQYFRFIGLSKIHYINLIFYF